MSTFGNMPSNTIWRLAALCRSWCHPRRRGGSSSGSDIGGVFRNAYAIRIASPETLSTVVSDGWIPRIKYINRNLVFSGDCMAAIIRFDDMPFVAIRWLAFLSRLLWSWAGRGRSLCGRCWRWLFFARFFDIYRKWNKWL